MIAAVGVGVPGWPQVVGGWDLWPLAGFAFVLLVARWGLGIRIGPIALVAAVLTGPLASSAVHAFGVTGAAGLGLAIWILALVVRRNSAPPKATTV